MTPEEYLKNCTDKELFKIVNGVVEEIKDRLIKLFKDYNCTIVEVPRDEGFEVNVNNLYDIHKWENPDMSEKWVKVSEIGYGTILDNDNTSLDYLYIVTDKSEMYSNDEINGTSLWDMYATVRDFLQTAHGPKE